MTADRPGRPRWGAGSFTSWRSASCCTLAGIAVALWILRLVARGLAAGLGAWWPAGVANVVLPILAVHFVYRGITRALERRPAAELALRGGIPRDDVTCSRGLDGQATASAFEGT